MSILGSYLCTVEPTEHWFHITSCRDNIIHTKKNIESGAILVICIELITPSLTRVDLIKKDL